MHLASNDFAFVLRFDVFIFVCVHVRRKVSNPHFIVSNGGAHAHRLHVRIIVMLSHGGSPFFIQKRRLRALYV
jgi:hypothetical protein